MITKLADKWRKEAKNHIEEDEANRMYSAALNQAATDLWADLPTWTRITDDPDTWPEMAQEVIWTGKLTSRPNISTFFGFDADWYRIYWRPLCDLDYPPEQES